MLFGVMQLSLSLRCLYQCKNLFENFTNGHKNVYCHCVQSFLVLTFVNLIKDLRMLGLKILNLFNLITTALRRN